MLRSLVGSEMCIRDSSTISKEMKNNEALQVNDIKEFYTYMTEGWPAKPDNWEEIIAYNLK